MNHEQQSIKVGIAGIGALGSIVAKSILDGFGCYELTAISELNPPDFVAHVPCVSFDELCRRCDLVVETLPPSKVPALLTAALDHQTDIVLISGSTLLTHPDLLERVKKAQSRVIVPSGALSGLDGVTALAQREIAYARIRTTKKPAGFKGAPYIVENNIDLDAITQRQLVFTGSAMDAAAAFPANVNVAATLSIAGIGPERTEVEIWADPEITGNTHEIEVKGGYSTIECKVSNMPDPSNPKSSVLAGLSIVSTLKKLHYPFTVI